MLSTILIPALSLGLLSSLHCVGMCGAIAFALPVQHLQPVRRTAAILLYHLGRISTYSLLGVLFGLAGRQLYLVGMQQWFSISLGLTMITFVIFRLFGNPFYKLPVINKLHHQLLKIIGTLIRKNSVGRTYLLGMANGLLPCGMVYFALAAALTTGNLSSAVSFMFIYGLGTVPAMLLVSYFGYRAKLSSRMFIKKAAPFFIAAMGMFFVLRGMGLNIPYVSPLLPSAPKEAVSCH